MTIEIEKGIPIPKQGDKSGAKFPFDKLEIGDCFFVPLRYGDTLPSLQTNLAQAGRYHCMIRKKDYRYHTYREYNGVRLWRIK